MTATVSPTTDDDGPVVPDLSEIGDGLADHRTRLLVHLLVEGHTDSSAARRLRVSPRTVTNLLRALMDDLGVDNRFQLGIALGRRAHTAVRPSGAVR